ncbi:outer membrane lipoprotein-sorting protein [Alteromonas sp. a30]|uniref:outer membrane lipoprotein-sorting protein n=1 Tax=Alteromonas sp. a30 TaxID=2730917 RepID=UPI00227E6B54|nr:outer membrane lipoprotein-sorting protein [Alteromonas sp. a30]MCY7295218.1 outer membrane lipoprotein-sorting protein [Alteromonas sp. a30]
MRKSLSAIALSLVFALNPSYAQQADAAQTATHEASSSMAEKQDMSSESMGAKETAVVSEEVRELFHSLEKNSFPPSAIATMSLASFKGEKESKSLSMEFFAKGDNVLIEILSPRVDKGKYILKSSEDLWMYFSKINRSIRIAARDSFMGTDANNYDLLELNLVDDYDIVSHTDEMLDGKPVIRAELRARPDTEGYSRIVSYIDPINKTIIRNDCFAISDTMIKSIAYFDHQMVGDYKVPMKTTIQNHLEKGRHSVMTFDSVNASDDIEEFMFSLGYLESLE